MTIPEAAQLVMQASAMSNGGEVFVLDMESPVCILDLAKSMIRLHDSTYLENEVSGRKVISSHFRIASWRKDA